MISLSSASSSSLKRLPSTSKVSSLREPAQPVGQARQLVVTEVQGPQMHELAEGFRQARQPVRIPHSPLAPRSSEYSWVSSPSQSGR